MLVSVRGRDVNPSLERGHDSGVNGKGRLCGGASLTQAATSVLARSVSIANQNENIRNTVYIFSGVWATLLALPAGGQSVSQSVRVLFVK